LFFFSSRRRHTRWPRDWSSDVCSSDLLGHIYKGHILVGLLWMIGAIPVRIFVFLAAFASAGWGLGLFFFYLAAVMLHAYGVEDRSEERRVGKEWGGWWGGSA